MNGSALANLRHAYAQLANGGVRDSAQAKRLAGGLISPAIKALESDQREVGQLQARVAELEAALSGVHDAFSSSESGEVDRRLALKDARIALGRLA